MDKGHDGEIKPGSEFDATMRALARVPKAEAEALAKRQKRHKRRTGKGKTKGT